ncbi:MAG: hypothetical protein AAF968_01180 [Pseudomonadota bacterium]
MMTQSPKAIDRIPEDVAVAQQPDSHSENHVLPRRGQRPLAFAGSELCMAMSYMPGARFWYELNIYRAEGGGFVVKIDMFTKDDSDPEMHDAWECDGFGDVMDSLEAYDAAGDIRIEVEPDDPGLSVADLAAYAMAIRARAEDARRQYRSLVGELLHDLETA